MVRRSSSVMPGVAAGGYRTMDVPGWSGGPTVIQCIPPYSTSLRTSKPRASRKKARAASGSSCGRKLERMVRSMAVMLAAAPDRCFSIPDRSGNRGEHSSHGGREVLAGEGGASGDEVGGGALEDDPAAVVAGAWAEVDDVVGDRDRLRLVLHEQHRVALVAQLPQQVVHALDVVGVHPDRRLVEYVGDVGERGPEVTDHLGALRLATRQRARQAVEAEVAEPDLRERIEGLPQRGEQRRHRRLVEAAHPRGEVGDLHRAGVGDVDPVDLRRSSCLAEPGAAALGAGGEGDRPPHEGADVRLQRVDVLGQHRLLDLRDQTLVGQVDAVDLDLGRLLVEQVVELSLGELADRLVRVEEAAATEDAAVPAVHAVTGDRERTLVERLAVVVQLRQVEVGDRAPAFAARTHAAGDAEAATLLHGSSGALERDRTRSAN